MRYNIGMSWHLYILKCDDASLYTGITNDLDRRIGQHNHGKASKYTASRLPVKLIYSELHPDRSSASKREVEIKSWARKKKLGLIKVPRFTRD
jgi:putative endonuclease